MLADRPALRLLLTGLVALALVAAGVAIGASLWPRMVTVERRVIAPAVRAVSPAPTPDAIPDLVDAACPAVVAIVPQGGAAPPAKPGRTGKQRAASHLAGFLVSGNGDVLTSAALLPETGDVSVLLNDGRRLPATRAGDDPATGLALLKIDASDLPFLQFATDNFPRIGETAVALSSPAGSGCAVQLGIVGTDFVAEQNGERSYVRVSPVLRPALAGAPVLDGEGAVIGIAGLRLAAEKGAGLTDASLLVPAPAAARALSDLVRNGHATDNPVGLYADDLTPALAARLGATRQRGAVVTAVVPHSSAAAAGFRAGDIVLSVDDAPVAGASELARALDGAGDEVSVAILRRSDEMTLDLHRPPSS